MINSSLSSLVGVGLRTPHLFCEFETQPSVGWFEVHSENYFNEGSPAFNRLLAIRETYPISLHGVGLSLGSSDGVASQHINRLKRLVDRVEPFLVSEHVSWNTFHGLFMPDLFPIPYTPESFDILVTNIDKVQNSLKRILLIENPSSYIEYTSTIEHEADFLVRLAQKTGARLLIDINNIYVSCQNHGWDPLDYIRAIPGSLVEECHVAGHSEYQLRSGKKILIDTHDKAVSDAVWDLYYQAILRWGELPTLIEWDANIPDYQHLGAEADKALMILTHHSDKKYA